ncbi:class IV adenylate cyclase [Saccharopolyspora cebuensis]|uniref:Class IV adenylate cyclase n=1 Tax=Saccharopolyspora cebuensis TaxID=418759 RepID=A0ABV4CGG4_9PSEU
MEVERKRELPDHIDPAALVHRLVGIGFIEVGRLVEIDTYYSRPDVDFMVTVECLRVRERNGFAEITYKPASTGAAHSAADIITKPETNVLLDADQAPQANQLLAAIGMVQLVRVEKDRTTLRHPEHDTVTVAVDTIAGVGSFVETEVLAPTADGADELLENTEQRCGFDDLPVVRLPYRDLVMERAPDPHLTSSRRP